MVTMRTFACAAVIALGCGGGSAAPDAQTDNFDRPALLANIGENLLLPAYEAFAADAQAFEQAVSAQCGGSGTVEASQNAWRTAMASWQIAEAILFGPAAMNERDLKTRIYSWPLSDSCAVDQEVAAFQQSPAGFDIATRINDRRGLDAAEYLLFAPNLDHTCPTLSAPPNWNALPEEDRATARCEYTKRIAADLVLQAGIITTAWRPDGGNYLGELANAGTPGSSFATAQDAINVVTDSIFFVDSDVKDMKLGQPAGITENACATMQTPCEAELESPFADVSKENVAINLRALELVYLGDSLAGDAGLGFDDFLRELGANQLADGIATHISAALASTEAIPGSLRAALATDYASVVAAHAAVRLITDDLKSQFIAVLGVDAPSGVADDND